MPTLTGPKVELGELSRLPAGPILVRLRRVLITTGIAAVVYTMLCTGSVGACSDSGASDGVVQTTCRNIALRPSWLVYAAFAVILFVVIGRIARNSATVTDALRLLDRAAGLIIAIALVSGAIALTWMMLFPIDTLADGGTIVFPFPFGSPELTVTHQP
ncbi:hypothetical protein [Leifsonia sp. NCR5]|uniref:hypothetical protein n=1 Tax=Leifsonia sp. NCR5 TaxID=1978342 RepID=UPI000A199864|nr:hypothetical protein [Leifsonia sp. NCR5]